jgi:hypothetical protein
VRPEAIWTGTRRCSGKLGGEAAVHELLQMRRGLRPACVSDAEGQFQMRRGAVLRRRPREGRGEGRDGGGRRHGRPRRGGASGARCGGMRGWMEWVPRIGVEERLGDVEVFLVHGEKEGRG